MAMAFDQFITTNLQRIFTRNIYLKFSTHP